MSKEDGLLAEEGGADSLGTTPLETGAQPFYSHRQDRKTVFECLNLHRRHLKEGQRATVAAKLANITNGGDRRSDQSANLHSGAVSQADAAEMLNVSTRSVASAAKVLHSGDEELVHAVER